MARMAGSLWSVKAGNGRVAENRLEMSKAQFNKSICYPNNKNNEPLLYCLIPVKNLLAENHRIYHFFPPESVVFSHNLFNTPDFVLFLFYTYLFLIFMKF